MSRGTVVRAASTSACSTSQTAALRPHLLTEIAHRELPRTQLAWASTTEWGADLVPICLGTDGQVLDVGRSHRLVTMALWPALIARDRLCAFPGCTPTTRRPTEPSMDPTTPPARVAVSGSRDGRRATSSTSEGLSRA